MDYVDGRDGRGRGRKREGERGNGTGEGGSNLVHNYTYFLDQMLQLHVH